MKSFDEFLATLTPTDQEAITKQALSELPNTGHTFSADEMRLMMKVASVSSVFMREMLRRYHEWLSAQIG